MKYVICVIQSLIGPFDSLDHDYASKLLDITLPTVVEICRGPCAYIRSPRLGAASDWEPFQAEFSSVGKSLLKTAVMMIGEFDYSSIFFDESQAVPFPEVTYTLFVAFLILMSIIIMNLLVSRATVAAWGVLRPR